MASVAYYILERLLIRIQRLFPDSAGMPEATAGRETGKRRS